MMIATCNTSKEIKLMYGKFLGLMGVLFFTLALMSPNAAADGCKKECGGGDFLSDGFRPSEDCSVVCYWVHCERMR
jgi:hypothetical protein